MIYSTYIQRVNTLCRLEVVYGKCITVLRKQVYISLICKGKQVEHKAAWYGQLQPELSGDARVLSEVCDELT